MAKSSGPRLIRPNNGRRQQWRRMRHVRFDDARKERFLNHFAGCADVLEAARVAGVDESTVYKHRRKDPTFAAAFDEALDQAYARLEAEAVRARIEAQKRMRRAMDKGVPTGDVAAEFERVIRLLDRWDRRNGRLGVRTISPDRRQPLDFDESIALLDTKLRRLAIPILRLPGDIAGRYDGDEPGTEGGDGPDGGASE
jgi:hypothetical protein